MTDEECKRILDSVGGYDEAKKILTMMGIQVSTKQQQTT